MSRAKTVCLTFRDFLNGPVSFQVPEGYRRLQLNHFSVTWSYGDELNKQQWLHWEELKHWERFVSSIIFGQFGMDIPEGSPLLTDKKGLKYSGFKGLTTEKGYWRVNQKEFDVPFSSMLITDNTYPGRAFESPWIKLGSFVFPENADSSTPVTTLTQLTPVSLRYATIVPNSVLLSCTGLGAWNDIIASCPFPGHEPALGMQGNTYEIVNPSLTFTVLTDNMTFINNLTLIVQFTLL